MMRNVQSVFILLCSLGSISMAIDEPSYTVIKSDGKIEIRKYSSYIIAETFVSVSDMNDASNAGFKKLFKYISGNNLSKTDIAMTAPVTTSKPETIVMTAPVTTKRSADGYSIAFVMPLKFTLATTPVPNDSTIIIREVPSRTVAVISFSGRWSDGNMNEHENELIQWLKNNTITVIGMPMIARYDPPFMPWFWRRNEIQIEIVV